MVCEHEHGERVIHLWKLQQYICAVERTCPLTANVPWEHNMQPWFIGRLEAGVSVFVCWSRRLTTMLPISVACNVPYKYMLAWSFWAKDQLAFTMNRNVQGWGQYQKSEFLLGQEWKHTEQIWLTDEGFEVFPLSVMVSATVLISDGLGKREHA